MSKGIKVVAIGGGSSYTPELVEGFLNRYDQFPLSELWLVDIEEGKEKLEIVGNLAQRMIVKSGLPIHLCLTLNSREALEGADFVITQLRVGLLEARIKDEKIPVKYGVIGQETNGPGGLFKGLRTIPVIMDISKDMDELCPDAWLINFTNPSGMVTEAIFRYTNRKKFVGLCNVPIGMERRLAEAFGVEPERARLDFCGLNHMVFGIRAYIDGIDRTEEAVKLFASPKEQYSMKNIKAVPWDPEFIEALGVIPCSYHRYYYKTREMLPDTGDGSEPYKTRAEAVKQVEHDLFEKYKDPNLDVKPPELALRGGAHYSEVACNLICSIYNDKRDIHCVNTLNNGAIPFLPNDVAVEVSALITKDGPVPLTVGNPPVACQGLIYSIKSFERVAAEAAVTGDYKTALLAMTINPLVPSDTIARQIIDEMLEAHKEYLPQFYKNGVLVK